jgi:hypothetical protein
MGTAFSRISVNAFVSRAKRKNSPWNEPTGKQLKNCRALSIEG